MLGSQRNRYFPQGFSGRRTPKRAGRHIASHDATRPDYRSFANSDVRQDHAVRPDEDIFFNDYFTVADWPSGTRIKMGDDRCSETDGAVIPNRNVRWVQFIYVDKLADPDVFPYGDAAQPLQPGSRTESAWRHKSYFPRESTEQNWQYHRSSNGAPGRSLLAAHGPRPQLSQDHGFARKSELELISVN